LKKQNWNLFFLSSFQLHTVSTQVFAMIPPVDPSVVN